MNKNDFSDFVKFSVENPWNAKNPQTLIRRFLTELITNEKMIFDLNDKQGRAATAVMLDKVNNIANDSCLEILGIRNDLNSTEIFAKIISWAKENIPIDRAGFQIGISLDRMISREQMKHLDLSHYYDTFEMECIDFSNTKTNHNCEIQSADKKESESVYKVLCESFANNLETSIPDRDTWLDRYLIATKTNYYLYRRIIKLWVLPVSLRMRVELKRK